MNLRPSGYEPDELPGCSTPRWLVDFGTGSRPGCGLRPVRGLRCRGLGVWVGGGLFVCGAVWRAWRRPTLPRLETQYHWRRGFSRPSSGWDRVFFPSLWPPGRPGRRWFEACGVRGREASCAGGGVFGGDCRRFLFCHFLFVSFGFVSVIWCSAQARDRAISTGQLHGLPRFHLRPIDVVVYHGSRRDLVLR